jgi:hypothetical protein
MSREAARRRAYFELDAYSPQQIAEKVETIGVAKARLPAPSIFLLPWSPAGSSA